jgi:N-acetylglucosaminyl-diphospho-decaprenol L-rhamnosyltransferase
MHTDSDKPINGLDDVTVVIVTYFSAACINPLAKVLNELKNVIFVDNGSTDNTRCLIQSLIPHARVLALPENIGFGAANNRAFSEASTRFVAIVNPDIAFTSTALMQLIDVANRYPDAAFIAPQLVDKRGRLDISYRFPRYFRGEKTWESKAQAADALTCVGFASGAFLLARTDALIALRGFDEDFFLYYEDDDLCTRAFNAGMSIIVEPNAVVTHFSRGSVKTSSTLKAEYFRAKHHTNSKLLFDRKHNALASTNGQTWKLAKLWAMALIALPIRLIIPSKKYSAYLGRVLGRLSALYAISLK